MAKLYGYARVSMQLQNNDRQIMALTEYSVAKTQIFADKLSGKGFAKR